MIFKFNGLKTYQVCLMILLAVGGIGLALAMIFWLPNALHQEDAARLDNYVENEGKWRYIPTEDGVKFKLNAETYSDFDRAHIRGQLFVNVFRGVYAKIILENVWILFGAGAASLGLSCGAAHIISHKEGKHELGHNKPISSKAELLDMYKWGGLIAIGFITVFAAIFHQDLTCMKHTQRVGYAFLGMSGLMHLWMLINVVDEYVIRRFDWEAAKQTSATKRADTREFHQKAQIERWEQTSSDAEGAFEINGKKCTKQQVINLYVKQKQRENNIWARYHALEDGVDIKYCKPTDDPHNLFGTNLLKEDKDKTKEARQQDSARGDGGNDIKKRLLKGIPTNMKQSRG